MIAPKFIRYQKIIINIVTIEDIWFDKNANETKVCYITKGSRYSFDGDCCDELWELIKLALASKGESHPSDTTHLEQRIKGIEEKIGDTFTIENREPATERTVIGYTQIGDPVYAS